MKKLSLYLFCTFVVPLTIANLCSAQTKQAPTLQPPPANIRIDGDIKEWGDSLRYYNAEKMINFSVANNKDTLYLAIRVNDRSEQARILRAGITFSIDPKGKKKETFSLIFPLNLDGGTPLSAIRKDDNGDITQQDRDELIRERLTTLRGIRVVGFKDIEGDMITTSNTYGIQMAINYDEKDYLVCEAAIPLKFFHADDPAKNEWAFNFRINGIQRKPQSEGNEQEGSGSRGGRGGSMGGMGGGGRGGRGGGRGGQRGAGNSSTDHTELSKSVDFWEKFYLAK
jgi:uncharacterized membrane protein YgcG